MHAALSVFRVGDDGNLVRLTRGKPSPFWTLIEAPESYDGAKVIGDDGKLMGLPSGFTLLQVAAEREDKPAKAKAKSAWITMKLAPGPAGIIICVMRS